MGLKSPTTTKPVKKRDEIKTKNKTENEIK